MSAAATMILLSNSSRRRYGGGGGYRPPSGGGGGEVLAVVIVVLLMVALFGGFLWAIVPTEQDHQKWEQQRQAQHQAEQSLVGKTVSSVDKEGFKLTLKFTDGTSLQVSGKIHEIKVSK